ncbi:right-handed parallel beta-helix repeat-containing protein [bacterium]|nr:right-handed parallel beta-helix repeat-containing protein [bacterium]
MFCLMAVILFMGCERDAQVDPWWVFAPHSQHMIPTRVLAHHLLPIAVNVQGNIRATETYDFIVESSPALITPTELIVKRGRGAALTATGESGETTVSGTCAFTVVGFDAALRILDHPPMRELSGSLSGDDLVWDSTSVIFVASNIQIPAGSSLMIHPGTIVTLASLAEIRVEGGMHCLGEHSPIQFLPEQPGSPWGQIDHRPGSFALYENCFFVGGGGNPARAFGHSSSQPVLGGEECTISAENIVIMDCPGKAFGLLKSEVSIANSLITRCDTGGEFHASLVQISDSYFLDIPDADHVIADNDNDGIYFYGAWNGGAASSLIDHCVLMTCEDDAIDHNGADLHVSGCVIDGMFHEGIAASNALSITVANSLITNCQQGIEAGWGEPEVIVDHCAVLNNQIGLRLGDSYDTGCFGSIDVTNSIFTDNDSLNIRNYDLAIEGPRENAISITYSIVNQADYDSGLGCLTGTPAFNFDFQLLPNSIGQGAASDHQNMGLLPF